jgi:hypothetical protein
VADNQSQHAARITPEPNETNEQFIARLQEQLRLKTEESEAKDNIIDTQTEQLAAANAQGATSLSVITVDKKRYQVLAGQFSLDDKVIQHTELKTDTKLAKEVVTKFPGLVQLLPDAPKA